MQKTTMPAPKMIPKNKSKTKRKIATKKLRKDEDKLQPAAEDQDV